MGQAPLGTTVEGFVLQCVGLLYTMARVSHAILFFRMIIRCVALGLLPHFLFSLPPSRLSNHPFMFYPVLHLLPI